MVKQAYRRRNLQIHLKERELHSKLIEAPKEVLAFDPQNLSEVDLGQQYVVNKRVWKKNSCLQYNLEI